MVKLNTENRSAEMNPSFSGFSVYFDTLPPLVDFPFVFRKKPSVFWWRVVGSPACGEAVSMKGRTGVQFNEK